MQLPYVLFLILLNFPPTCKVEELGVPAEPCVASIFNSTSTLPFKTASTSMVYLSQTAPDRFGMGAGPPWLTGFTLATSSSSETMAPFPDNIALTTYSRCSWPNFTRGSPASSGFLSPPCVTIEALASSSSLSQTPYLVCPHVSSSPCFLVALPTDTSPPPRRFPYMNRLSSSPRPLSYSTLSFPTPPQLRPPPPHPLPQRLHLHWPSFPSSPPTSSTLPPHILGLPLYPYAHPHPLTSNPPIQPLHLLAQSLISEGYFFVCLSGHTGLLASTLYGARLELPLPPLPPSPFPPTTLHFTDHHRHHHLHFIPSLTYHRLCPPPPSPLPLYLHAWHPPPPYLTPISPLTTTICHPHLPPHHHLPFTPSSRLRPSLSRPTHPRPHYASPT